MLTCYQLTAEDIPASGSSTPDEGRTEERGLNIEQNLAQDELELEERLGMLQAEKQELALDKRALQQELRELHDRLIRLQDNNVRIPFPWIRPVSVANVSSASSTSKAQRCGGSNKWD